ncbi:glycosyltransferase family 2 protein [Microbacterium lacticum]
MRDKSPLLTVGVTTFERPVSLMRALGSVLEDAGVTDRQLEVIVVDDASTSSEAMQAWAELEDRAARSRIPLRLVRHSVGSGGASAGRNDVIDLAKGHFVFFLDDDNYFADGALVDLLGYLSRSSSDWISVRRSRGGRSYFLAPEVKHDAVSREAALWTFLAGGAFRVDYLRAHGIRFDPTVNRGEDAEFVLNVASRSERFSVLSDRDYFVEANPDNDEAPHISQALRGVDFIEVLLSHLSRMFRIIEHAPVAEAERLVLRRKVLGRGMGPYQLLQKVAGVREDRIALELADRLREVVLDAVGAAAAMEWATTAGRADAMVALLARDLSALRRSLA